MAKRKITRTALVKKLDKIFSEYIRRRNGEIVNCVTCGSKAHWKKMQAGHFMSRRHMSTRWHEDNVQVQCPKCNIWDQGQQYAYSKFLGEIKSEELLQLSKEIVKFTDQELIEMTEQYEQKVNNL